MTGFCVLVRDLIQKVPGRGGGEKNVPFRSNLLENIKKVKPESLGRNKPAGKPSRLYRGKADKRQVKKEVT